MKQYKIDIIFFLISSIVFFLDLEFEFDKYTFLWMFASLVFLMIACKNHILDKIEKDENNKQNNSNNN
jgi:hypothetical protein